jgi:hypothetical protein
MRAGLDEGRWVCEPQEPQYLAPAYRWVIVLDELTMLRKADSNAGPHPATRQWEQAYGRRIPGQSCAEQLQAVQTWHSSDLRDHTELRKVTFGAQAPSAIETAVGARIGEPSWDQRLADSLNYFADCSWPLIYLSATSGEPG